MDSLRSTRSQVALTERSLVNNASSSAISRIQTPPQRPDPQARAAAPRLSVVRSDPGPNRRPQIDELSIRAASQLRRTARPVGTIENRLRQNPQGARPVSSQPQSAAPQASVQSRPTRELPDPSTLAPSPQDDPWQALETLRQAVAQLPPDPAVEQALQRLGSLVEQASPPEQPPPEKPAADRPRMLGRGVLQKAPGYAMNRLLNTLAATSPSASLPPGAALDLQG